jgi:hypothetical protein
VQDPVISPTEGGRQRIHQERLVSADADPLAVLKRKRIVQAPPMFEGIYLGLRDLYVLGKPIGWIALDMHHHEQDDRD